VSLKTDMLTRKHAQTQFSHVHSGNGWIDLNQIWHIDFLGGRSDIFEKASKLVQGFGRSRGVKFCLSHWLYHCLLSRGVKFCLSHWLYHCLLTPCIALPCIRMIGGKSYRLDGKLEKLPDWPHSFLMHHQTAKHCSLYASHPINKWETRWKGYFLASCVLHISLFPSVLLSVATRLSHPFHHVYHLLLMPSVLWHCRLGSRKGIWSVKKLSGEVMSGARCNDLHMVQLTPLPPHHLLLL